jgi:hypothetical protein
MSSGDRRYHISSRRQTVDIEYHPGASKKWVMIAISAVEPGSLTATHHETTSASVLSEVAPTFAKELQKATSRVIADASAYTWFFVEDSHGLGKPIYDPYNRACVLVVVKNARPVDAAVDPVRMVLTHIPEESVRRAHPKLLAWVVSQLTNLRQPGKRWVASYPTGD